MENKSTGNPIKKNGYSNKKRLAKLNKKRAEAIERNARWQSLTLEAKIASLSNGRGQSKKQLKKLGVV